MMWGVVAKSGFLRVPGQHGLHENLSEKGGGEGEREKGERGKEGKGKGRERGGGGRGGRTTKNLKK